MPDVSAALNLAVQFVVVRYLDTLDDTFRGRYLVRSHHHQHPLAGEDTILGQYVQQSVFREECLGEVDEVEDGFVVAVCPERRKLKRVAGLLRLVSVALLLFLDMVCTGGVGIVFGVGAVADDENLHILVQTTSRPERVPLITVYLVERLFQLHATPLQFDMHQRKTIDQNGHIISCVVCAAIFLILVDDLQEVVVDVLSVYQVDVLALARVGLQHLNEVFLYLGGLRLDAVVFVRYVLVEETLPFCIGEGVVVQSFQLHTKVIHQVLLRVDG